MNDYRELEKVNEMVKECDELRNAGKCNESMHVENELWKIITKLCNSLNKYVNFDEKERKFYFISK
jgi:hypothetical protein